MTIGVWYVNGVHKEYEHIDNLRLGIDKNSVLDKLELYMHTVDGELITIEFEEEYVKNISKIKQNGLTIYRKQV